MYSLNQENTEMQILEKYSHIYDEKMFIYHLFLLKKNIH
jgi:hypothetical protein